MFCLGQILKWIIIPDPGPLSKEKSGPPRYGKELTAVKTTVGGGGAGGGCDRRQMVRGRARDVIVGRVVVIHLAR